MIGLRVCTNYCQKLNDESLNEVYKLLEEVLRFRITFKIKFGRDPVFLNFDQTPIYLDPRRNKTYDEIGKKEVLELRTSNYKSCLPVVYKLIYE